MFGVGFKQQFGMPLHRDDPWTLEPFYQSIGSPGVDSQSWRDIFNALMVIRIHPHGLCPESRNLEGVGQPRAVRDPYPMRQHRWFCGL